MGRVYSLRFDAQSVSAPNDLMTLVGVSSAMTRIISISVGQTTAAGNAAAEILPISIRRYATSGTGGTTRFRNPFNRGHGTAQVTGATNHTTLGGTPTVLYEEDWHVELPFQVTPIMWVSTSGFRPLASSQ